ncbi:MULTISPECIES: hypothetical protein [unclassified Agromyces]|uniref:hypothetical protein n=1 Tax=unclassified Agromyces TaxID=2639701 RepID=UPI0007B184C9|nr:MULTISPECIES: hypothetical protein [unclassified Agromyces]KZE93982.1 hypothetical protein AVP42_01372 [Agromyces sp. NDB4Y10]MCK8609362.1 hypothetical protein [Agromyces sp. C10]
MSDIPPEEDREDRTGTAGDDGQDGAGSQGTIPDAPDGVGVGVTEEKNTFEPEEDPDVTGVHE